MTLSRRQFLKNGAGLAALATSGCGPGLSRYGSFSDCNPTDNGALVIDAHCHLLNQKDGSARELVANRVLNLDEAGSPALAWMIGTLAQIIGEVLGVATKTARAENEVLAVELRKALGDPYNLPARASNRDLCFFADTQQSGLIRAGRNSQLTGFFSNRLRNAAQMMLLYPDVDLFLASMVDFYEGKTRVVYRNHISFYSNLALVTRGRFLPLASFSPEREYDERTLKGWGPDDSYTEKSQFWWLKRAITHLGFVGVKVHPSSGFSPTNNLAFGCTNRSRYYETLPDSELYKRFTAYDEYMEELLDFCKAANVPILTHGNLGLTIANEGCMTGARPSPADTPRGEPQGAFGDPAKDEWFYPFGARFRRDSDSFAKRSAQGETRRPEDFTASPRAWDTAMRDADDRNPALPPAKVIMGHFAGSFEPKQKRGKWYAAASPWLENLADLTKRNPHLYADLSELSTLFKEENRKSYAIAFERFLRDNRHITRHMIYGSDWHMPGTARIGRRYIDLVRNLLPEGPDRRQIMGERAADVFGLRPGTVNMARLEQFFATAPNIWGVSRANPQEPEKDPSLKPEDISWWSKV